MKRKVEKYDFKALGQAIKAARNAKGIQESKSEERTEIKIKPFFFLLYYLQIKVDIRNS